MSDIIFPRDRNDDTTRLDHAMQNIWRSLMRALRRLNGRYAPLHISDA